MTVSIATIWQPPSHTYRSNLWMCQCFNLHKKSIQDHCQACPSNHSKSSVWIDSCFFYVRKICPADFLPCFNQAVLFWGDRRFLVHLMMSETIMSTSGQRYSLCLTRQFARVRWGWGWRDTGWVPSRRNSFASAGVWCLQGGPRIQLYMEFFSPREVGL